MPGDDAAKNGLTSGCPPASTSRRRPRAPSSTRPRSSSPSWPARRAATSRPRPSRPPGPYLVKGCELPADVPAGGQGHAAVLRQGRRIDARRWSSCRRSRARPWSRSPSRSGPGITSGRGRRRPLRRGRQEAGPAARPARLVDHAAGRPAPPSGRPAPTREERSDDHSHRRPQAGHRDAGRPEPGAARARTRYWFYLPAAVIFAVLFLVPTFASFFFSLTRWTLFDCDFIGLDNFVAVLPGAGAGQGPGQHARSTPSSPPGSRWSWACCWRCCSPPRSSAAASCARWSSSRCWSAPSASASPSSVLMNPTKGLINQALALVGIEGPAWLVDPSLALLSVALVDVWKGVGLATVIYIAGIVSIPQEYFEAARVDGASAVQELPAHHPAAGPAGHRHRDHPVADRRPALVRPDLGDDPRRARASPPTSSPRSSTSSTRPASTACPPPATSCCSCSSPRSSCRCPGSSTARRSTCERHRRSATGSGAARRIVVVSSSSSSSRSPSSCSPRSKDRQRGRRAASSRWPTSWPVRRRTSRGRLAARDYMLVIAFINSTILTVASVAVLVVLRRDGRLRAAAPQSRLDRPWSTSWCCPG